MMSTPSFGELLARAKRGDQQALGAVLENYRAYLRLLAQRQLDSAIQTRVDASDIVQQTFLEAQRDLASFRGTVPEQFSGWLRQILVHNVAHATQTHVRTQKRSVRREITIDDSANGLPRGAMHAADSSPSARAMRGEAAVILAQAIGSLPTGQCQAIRLRYLEGWTLAQIANRMERSEDAVAGLIKRGLRGLRNRL